MLRRAVSGAVVVLLMAGLILATQPLAAQAGSHGGGNPFGSVSCGQSYSPSCAVSAGSPFTAGSTGAPQGGKTGAAQTAGETAASGCSGMANKSFGCVPAGCQITVQTLACPLGVPGTAGGPAAPPPPAPGVLAQLAVRYLRLPDPVIRSSPAPDALQLTQLPVWLWIAANAWQPQSKTAQVPGESVTATATPVSASWQMGDGRTVTCHGPGTPYSGRDNPAAPSPTCGHTYDRSSAGQPAGTYQVTVTVTWDISWTASGGAGGALPPLDMVAAAGFRVAESQALDVGSGG